VLFGQRLRALAGWLATLAVAAAFVVAVAALFELLSQPADARTQILRGYEWFVSGDLRVALDLRWDPLSATMALVVTGVSSLIHLYSIGYMEHDERRETFFSWLNLFVASMLVLVLAQNFLVMFLGWEGVGLCSYLLVGFWFNRRLLLVNPLGRLVEGEPDDTHEVWAPPAAKKAFLANRIGDIGFLLAMFLIFATVGSLDFDVVFGKASGLASGTATAIALLLFLACTGKSAQFPLYVWLPDAMAGPTPVSALIHAATMVTAGVFLVARTHVLFEVSGTAQTVVVLVGAGTALLAALIAIGQDDIKKILAYSTVSQLGYMFIGVGLGPIGYAAGMFHLVTHAFFKAQLFLGAGSVMHGNDEDTDIKHFGGLRSAMPLTFWTTMAAWAAIIGVPLTAGFFSKDQVLAAAFEHGGVGLLAWGVGVLTAGLTAFYMSRPQHLHRRGRPLPDLPGASAGRPRRARLAGRRVLAVGGGHRGRRDRGGRGLAAVRPAVRLAGPAPPLDRGLAAPGRETLRRPGLRVLHRHPGGRVRRLPGPHRRPAGHRRRRQRPGRAGRQRRPLRPARPVRPGPQLRPRRPRGRRADRRLPGVPAMTPSSLEPPPCC
jgi:NADH-quinone oxidoreductase subunit L